MIAGCAIVRGRFQFGLLAFEIVHPRTENLDGSTMIALVH